MCFSEVRILFRLIFYLTSRQPKMELQSSDFFSRLPREVRDRVYYFAIPTTTWVSTTESTFLRNIVESMEICSGFCFPFQNISLLETCWQIRSEALAFAYRNTKFCLDDIDEVIQFLVAVGTTGRSNLRSLEFAWISKSDQNYQWEHAIMNDEFYPTLPGIHAEECVKLLQQCNTLSDLCLKFDETSIGDVDSEFMRGNLSLELLRSMDNLRNLKIVNIDGDPLEQTWFVEWLRGQSSDL